MGIYRADKRHIWACCRNAACLFCACDKPKSGLARSLGDYLQFRNVPFVSSEKKKLLSEASDLKHDTRK